MSIFKVSVRLPDNLWLLSAALLVSGLGLHWLVKSYQNTAMSLLLSSAPNFISAAFIGTMFALLFRKDEIRTSISFTVGLVMYEFLQLFISNRTFDAMDIAASFLGLLVSVCFLLFYFFTFLLFYFFTFLLFYFCTSVRSLCSIRLWQ